MDRIAILSIIFAFIFFTLLFYFINRVIKNNYRKNSKEDLNGDKFVVKTPKGILVFGWICCVALVVLAIIAFFAMDVESGKVGFICFMLISFILFMPMFIVANRWKVFVSGDEIKHIPSLGKKKIFKFSDITKAVYRRERVVASARGVAKSVMSYGVVDIYVNDKKMLCLKLTAENAHKFIKCLNKNNINVVDKKGNIMELAEWHYLVNQ